LPLAPIAWLLLLLLLLLLLGTMKK